ncbi:hypothetical protein ACFJGW_20370 [Burkholderiaceae bacterium UC74_6]
MKRIAAPLVLSLALLTGAAHADGINAGIQIEDKITLADIGLPAYPGATLLQEGKGKDDDKGSFGMSLWGGSFGLKLSLLKYRSGDSIDQVGRFYRDALGHYGKVLDCSVTAPSDDDRKDEKKTIALRCSKDDVKAGKLVIKVGKDEKHFRMVAIERKDGGVQFVLLNFAVNGD